MKPFFALLLIFTATLRADDALLPAEAQRAMKEYDAVVEAETGKRSFQDSGIPKLELERGAWSAWSSNQWSRCARFSGMDANIGAGYAAVIYLP